MSLSYPCTAIQPPVHLGFYDGGHVHLRELAAFFLCFQVMSAINIK